MTTETTPSSLPVLVALCKAPLPGLALDTIEINNTELFCVLKLPPLPLLLCCILKDIGNVRPHLLLSITMTSEEISIVCSEESAVVLLACYPQIIIERCWTVLKV